MKNKLLVSLLVSFFTAFSFSQNIELNYVITEDAVEYYREFENVKTKKIQKGTIVTSNSLSSVLYKSDFPQINSILLNNEAEEDYYIPVFFAKPINTSSVLSTNLITHDQSKRIKNLIPAYYLEILKDGNLSKLENYEKHFSVEYAASEIGIFSGNGICNNLSNCGIYFYSENIFVFKNITKKNENLYEIEGIAKGDYDETSYDFDCFRWTSILRNTPDNGLDKIAFQIDGDYLTINDCSNGNHIITLVYVEDSLLNEIESLFRNNKRKLSKVNWPHHADGSCDFDGIKTTAATQTANSTSSTNVIKNKTMTVNENLKLRSGEATSTQVLAVMSAGAKVRILELGWAETIDGIPSNWVKVEVQQGAKDRDGQPIKGGTVGWCFGGYLE